MNPAAKSLAFTAVAAGVSLGVASQVALEHFETIPLAPRSSNAASSVTQPRAFSMEPTVDPAVVIPAEVSRRVLALYDRRQRFVEDDGDGHRYDRPVDPEVSAAHRHAEVVLNHLGIAVEHADISKLPSPEQMSRYRGVLAWIDDIDGVADWLAAQADAGRRVALVGMTTSPALWSALGATDLGDGEGANAYTLAFAHDKLMGFERPVPKRFNVYRRIRASNDSQVLLQIGEDGRRGTETDAVWTNARGGFIMTGLAVVEDRVAERYVRRWLVDPFEFFGRAFDLHTLPRPDFTTLNGRRIFYSQVDGDGLDTISELDYESLCGDVIREQIFERYPLPFTASVVVGLTAPPPIGKGTQRTANAARRIFALDNVEIASHGLAHPLDWRAGEVPNYSKQEVSVPDLPGYVQSGESEIAASVEYIDAELAPPGKQCKVMLWTGWCNPTSEQLSVAYRLGLANMNGGDPRMDDHYPSVAHLVAPIHDVGGRFQFYTSAANDFIHTDLWQAPFYRFRNVIQTFERTESPRRLMPVDVYFHFYSARNQAALRALFSVFDWVSAQPMAPLFTSEYVDIARDFHWVRLARRGDDWVVYKGPALRTVRFDQVDMHVDMRRSSGVLGYEQDPERRATYVHLDGRGEVLIAAGRQAPSQPYLLSASAWVDTFVERDGGVEITARGFGKQTFVIGGLAPAVAYGNTIADENGRLEFTAEVESTGTVILVSPHGDAR